MIPKREEEHKSTSASSSADLIIIEQKGQQNGQPIKRYSKGKLLGKGGFAKCYEVTSLDTKKVYAAKIIEKSSLNRSKAKEKLTSEIKIHKSLDFQYIVRFEHCFEDAECVYILLEVCPNQTLNQLIKRRKRLTEVEAQCYLYQVALALKYMHARKVIHRDLKLGNMFLSEKLEIKIGDFGLAARLETDSERRKTMCGTPNYIAPEILDNKSGHSYEVDVWSFGVIAYALLVGRPPFETNDVKTTYNKIRMCNYTFPDSIQLSRSAKNFISKMLQLEPSKRLTIEQILSHEFFTSNPFPKNLPISCLACPPNANFIKKFQPLRQQSIQNRDQPKKLETTDKLNTSRGAYDMGNTDRVQSLNKQKLQSTRTSTEHCLVSQPQRAASSTALVGHKFVPKKSVYEEPSVEIRGPEIWVTHHVENPKFGTCYLLNSNVTGMQFNDSTCFVSNSGFTKIKYFEINQQLEEAAGQVYDIGNTDPTLAKKMKIILHFNQELRAKRDLDEAKMNHEQRFRAERLKYKKETADTAMQLHVRKFMKLPKAMIFWFSNKDFQIIFQDFTEILLRQNNAVYVNKFSERKYFLFSEYETMSEEIQKRMRYAIEVTKKIKAKPRTSSINHNDENRRPTTRSGTSLKHSGESLKDRNKQKKELPRNSSYGRLGGVGFGHETDRHY